MERCFGELDVLSDDGEMEVGVRRDGRVDGRKRFVQPERNRLCSLLFGVRGSALVHRSTVVRGTVISVGSKEAAA